MSKRISHPIGRASSVAGGTFDRTFGGCPLVIGGVVPEVEGLGADGARDGLTDECSFALLPLLPGKLAGGRTFATGGEFAAVGADTTAGTFAVGAFAVAGALVAAAAAAAAADEESGSFTDHLGKELVISAITLLVSYTVDVLG